MPKKWNLGSRQPRQVSPGVAMPPCQRSRLAGERRDPREVLPTTLDMLQTLHSLMPTFNFPQYKERLLSNGICYGRSVTDFTQSYYVDKVGMSDGAAAEFVRSANQMLGKQKREQGRKKARLARKENQPIRLDTPEL